MDPLKQVNEELFDLIFQHLTTEEILTYSLVSSVWYKIIGNSRIAMSKIWLNAGDRFFNPSKDDFKLFINSHRNYENFRLSELENGILFVVFNRKWKRVQLDVQSFLNCKEYVKILEIFESSIEELEIFDMSVEYLLCEETLAFNNLKKLKIGSTTLCAIKPFLKVLPKLTHLKLEEFFDLSCKENERDEIIELLGVNHQIKHLSINSKILEKVLNVKDFPINLQNVKNLEKFIVEFDDETKFNPYFHSNMNNFLNLNENLTWIVLCDCVDLKIFEICFSNLKSLKRCSIDYFDDSSIEKLSFDDLKLSKNNSIERLDFDIEGLTLELMKPFLLACPNIEILYVFHLSLILMEFLENESKNLKLIKYCCLSKEVLAFENISKFKLIEEKFVDLKKLF